jgi:hypothetical protein
MTWSIRLVSDDASRGDRDHDEPDRPVRRPSESARQRQFDSERTSISRRNLIQEVGPQWCVKR